MDDDDRGCLAALNGQLLILATVFPNIHPEVFRDLLITFDGDSRLQTAVEQLLKHQDRWVRGRWRAKLADPLEKNKAARHGQQLISAQDEFRRASYKWTSRKLLYEEFKALNRTKIKAVLAEENFCYIRSRSTLQKLASKTWRNALGLLIAKWRKPAETTLNDHYLLKWLTTQSEEAVMVPALRETGDDELDLELHQYVLNPLLKTLRREQEARDWEIAVAVNKAQAQAAGAVYECECCYLETTFEQTAFCTENAHVICFQCIWHAVSEALFGQAWGSNIEHVRGLVKCLASVSTEGCEGCIPQVITERAMLQSKGGIEALKTLEARVAEEAILKSNLPVIRCPCCTYAEANELYLPPTTTQYRLSTTHPRMTLLLLIVTLSLSPVLLIYTLISYFPPFRTLPQLVNMFSHSLAHLSRNRHLSRCFQCRSPHCGLQSCLSCLQAWNDPHVCHESATLSLRTTVEAARTAALKRTCPRCGLGFIKDSGCNKLTCICGYSLCYICRQGLTSGDGGEGYRHFCQHFRSAGGTCNECDKCDLYKSEDDETMVRKAGALAEKEWREKEGMMGVKGIANGQEGMIMRSWWEDSWTVQRLLDWWVTMVLTC